METWDKRLRDRKTCYVIWDSAVEYAERIASWERALESRRERGAGNGAIFSLRRYHHFRF